MKNDGKRFDLINNPVKLMIEYLLIKVTVVLYNLPHNSTLRLAFVFCRLVDAVSKQFKNVDSYLPRDVDCDNRVQLPFCWDAFSLRFYQTTDPPFGDQN